MGNEIVGTCSKYGKVRLLENLKGGVGVDERKILQ
jgi:hypothetical protein